MGRVETPLLRRAHRILNFLIFAAMMLTFPVFAQSTNTELHAASAFRGVITTTAITGLVGGAGWILAYVLNSMREDRTKRLQLTIEQTSVQIREFYAPLVALTDQLDSLAAIKAEAARGISKEAEQELSATFYEKFFLPIHEEINAILKSKVHLLEGASTPASFGRYFEHYASEKAYWHLTQTGKDVARMQIPGYPSEFYWDVRRDQQVVMNRYEESIQELQHPRAGWLFGTKPSRGAIPEQPVSSAIGGDVARR